MRTLTSGSCIGYRREANRSTSSASSSDEVLSVLRLEKCPPAPKVTKEASDQREQFVLVDASGTHDAKATEPATIVHVVQLDGDIVRIGDKHLHGHDCVSVVATA